MAKRKHYVYKVMATDEVCGNLQSAIDCAMMDMLRVEQKSHDLTACYEEDYEPMRAQLSAPIVSKVWGGYQVVAIGYNGVVRKRRIDVFQPYKANMGAKHYKVDRAYAMEYVDSVDEDEDED